MPLSFFWGEEDFLIQKEIDKIKSDILGDDISELNFRTSDNPDFSEFVYLLRSQPMMFGDILIQIKADNYFLEGKKNKLDDKQTDELINAIELISDKVHIILTSQIPRGERKKPDSRRKLYKAVQKNGVVKEFPAFRAYEEYKILPVLKTMVKAANLKAPDNALEALIRTVGPYLRDLNSALDKISLFIYPETAFSKETVENLYPNSQNIFALIDLILASDYSKTMFEISKMLQKSHYLEILAFFQSGFSKLLLTKIYSESKSSYEIATITKQNEYAVKMSLNKIKNIPLNRLLGLKKNLVNAEYEIKTGLKPPETALLEGFVK